MRPLTEAQFEDIYSKVPRLTAEAVVRTAGGVPLVLRSHPTWNGLWHLPGGTVFYREHIPTTLERVARHELGISIQVKNFLTYLHYPSEQQERGYGWTVGLLFSCTTRDTIPDKNGDGELIRCFKELPENLVEEQRAPLLTFLAENF